MWKLPLATPVAALAFAGAAISLTPSAAEAQYYSYSRSSSIGYTTSLVSSDTKAKGAIRRGYINKYGQVIATDHHAAEAAGSSSRHDARSVTPAQARAN